MNALSLFDGMSCGRIALDRAGIKVDNYFSSEIKPHAIKVANKNYPQDEKNRLGDVRKIDTSKLPKIHLLIGGSPCQDFSQANKQRDGLQGEKSSLFYEYARIFKELKPKYFLLENVKMENKEKEIISEILGVEPILYDSAAVSPQTRKRLYWTNIPHDFFIQEKKITLNEILENGYTNRKKSRAILAGDSKSNTTPIKMVHRYFNTGFTTLIFKNKEHYKLIKEHFYKHFKGKSAAEIDDFISKVENDFLEIYKGVRYMNKHELEACQTVPKGYTDCLKEKEAIDVLGDGWTVDVIAHIFRGLERGYFAVNNLHSRTNNKQSKL